jgi:hypothetical protein
MKKVNFIPTESVCTGILLIRTAFYKESLFNSLKPVNFTAIGVEFHSSATSQQEEAMESFLPDT